MSRTLLITGFDAFGGAGINPSWEAVKLLPEQIGDFTLHKLQIPTIFADAPARVIETAEAIHADVILCVGQAGGRGAVTPERIGVNIRDARIPDNAGNQPSGERIEETGPAAYFATVPVKEMAQAIRDSRIPGTVSNSAGAYVCNDTLYSLLHHFEGSNIKVGFIHVPWLPEQGNPSLPLEKTVAALIASIQAC